MPRANNRRNNQTTYLAAVVAVLTQARGGWVAAFLLADAGGLQWQTRVHEARRKLKLPIENYTVHKDGRVRSYYRIALGTPSTTPPVAPTPAPAPASAPYPLFPDLQPSRYVDPEESWRR